MKTGCAGARSRLSGDECLEGRETFLDQDLYQFVNSVQVLVRIIDVTRSGFGATLPAVNFAARVPADVWTAV